MDSVSKIYRGLGSTWDYPENLPKASVQPCRFVSEGADKQAVRYAPVPISDTLQAKHLPGPLGAIKNMLT